MQTKPELLSPVGSLSAFWAAINAGADAVYLGASQFGARAHAGFSLDDIAHMIRIAHFHGRKVHITINTLIKEKEFSSFIDMASQLAALKPDAFIVQDFGAVRLLKKCFPNISIHASTQMAIHNLSGAKKARDIGIDRVVFARETDLQTVVQAGQLGLETEVFVHGALCVSVSGLCELSAAIGGRSGNRGRCAQPCRLDWQYRGQTGAFLSTRDICAYDRMEDIVASNITSVKIEGRLKRPEYVAIVTSAYREAIDQAVSPGKSPLISKKTELLQVFNRGGFSSGYLWGGSDADIVYPFHVSHEGIPIGVVRSVRRANDIYLADVLLHQPLHDQDGLQMRGETNVSCIYSGKFVPENEETILRLRKPVAPGTIVYRLDDAELLNQAAAVSAETACPKIPVEAVFTASPGQIPKLTLKSRDTKAEVFGNRALEKSLTSPLTFDTVVRQLTKASGYPLQITSVTFWNSEAVFMPIGELNQMRRKAAEAFFENRIGAYEVKRSVPALSPSQINAAFSSDLVAIVDDITLRRTCLQAGADSVFYAPNQFRTDEWKKAVKTLGKNDAFVLPPICSDTMLQKIHRIISELDCNVVVRNIGHLAFDWPKKVIAGPELYAWNSYAVQMLKEQNVSAVAAAFELSEDEIAAICNQGLPVILPVYGRTPLMVLTHCPERVYKKLHGGHENCRMCEQGTGMTGQTLTDRENARYPLLPIHLPEGCRILLMSEKPLNLQDKANRDLPWALNFVGEQVNDITVILSAYRHFRDHGHPFPLTSPPRSLGRYLKGVE